MSDGQTFWEHLDALRGVLIRVVIAVVVVAVAFFCCKEWLFAIILAPSHDSFVTYRLIERLSGVPQHFRVELFNPHLAQQFIVHMKASLYMGFLAVSPYLLYLLFRFVSPALYQSERRAARYAVGGGYVMFMLGVALTYWVLFPLTFRFLGTYQVSGEIPNIIALSDYISVMLLLCLLMGVVFELPVLSWLLARIGVLHAEWMTRYRRHAIVVILVIAAIITPTGDPFTLAVVALPIYLLYELSVAIVRRTNKA